MSQVNQNQTTTTATEAHYCLALACRVLNANHLQVARRGDLGTQLQHQQCILAASQAAQQRLCTDLRYPTMSMTMSRLKHALQSAAMMQAWTTASGSSALTCRMGAPTILPTSDGCGQERASAGPVVKPTWLFRTMWIVPPVENPAGKS